MKLGLFFLSLIFVWPAGGQVDYCAQWKPCGPKKNPVISYAIESCKQEMAAADCEDFFGEDPEYAAHKRSCDPYVACRQRQDSDKMGETCDESLKELWEENVETVKGLKNLLSAQYWKDLYHNMSLEKYQLAATDLMEKKHRQYVCLDEYYRQKMMCYGIFMTLEGAVGGVLVKTAKNVLVRKFFSRGATVRKEAAVAASAVENGRERFIESHLHQMFTDEHQNSAWIAVAETDEAGSSVRYLDVENAAMKDLNDLTRNKNLVTSITNKNKEIILQKMIKLAYDNPGLEILPYTDYKSIRFAFRGKIPPNLEQQLSKYFDEANREFTDQLKENKIIRADENNSEKWFRAGYGSTADQANTAARYSRQVDGPNQMQSFSNPEVTRSLEGSLNELKSQRAALETDPALKNTTLLEEIPGSKTQTLSQPAFDLLRKSKSADEVIKSVKNKYGIALSKAQAQRMVDYSKLVDQFSPSLRIAERKLVNLDEADAGGFTVDFAGMGSRNLRATAEALERTTDMNTLLKETRKGEQAVTREFLEKVDTLQKKVASTGNADLELTANCSADDCVGVAKKALTGSDKQKIIDNFASDPRTSAVRVSFIPENVAEKAARTRIATHGESIEKFLRKNLEGVIPNEKLDSVVFGVDMQTTQLNRGSVQLLMSAKPGQVITSTERLQIQKAFKKAVEDHNADLRAQKIDSKYKAR